MCNKFTQKHIKHRPVQLFKTVDTGVLTLTLTLTLVLTDKEVVILSAVSYWFLYACACECAQVHVCVLCCYSLRRSEHSNLPTSLESEDAISMRGIPVWSPYLWEAHLVSCCSRLHYLCQLLLKHTFSRLSFLSYIRSGFHSSNSSWTIKIMTSKVNQADLKRCRTFCHKSVLIKLENQNGRKKVDMSYSHILKYDLESQFCVKRVRGGNMLLGIRCRYLLLSREIGSTCVGA